MKIRWCWIVIWVSAFIVGWFFADLVHAEEIVDSTGTVVCMICGGTAQFKNMRYINPWKHDTILPSEDMLYTTGLDEWITIDPTYHVHRKCVEQLINDLVKMREERDILNNFGKPYGGNKGILTPTGGNK